MRTPAPTRLAVSIACLRSADALEIVVATSFCWTVSMPPMVPVGDARTPTHSISLW